MQCLLPVWASLISALSSLRSSLTKTSIMSHMVRIIGPNSFRIIYLFEVSKYAAYLIIELGDGSSLLRGIYWSLKLVKRRFKGHYQSSICPVGLSPAPAGRATLQNLSHNNVPSRKLVKFALNFGKAHNLNTDRKSQIFHWCQVLIFCSRSSQSLACSEI